MKLILRRLTTMEISGAECSRLRELGVQLSPDSNLLDIF